MLKSHQIHYQVQKITHSLDETINKQTDLISAYFSNEPFVAHEKGLKIIMVLLLQ